MMGLRSGFAASAGLIIAPAIWAADMQAGQILPYPACHLQTPFTAILSFTSLILALASGYVSWRARQAIAPGAPESGSLRFIAALGYLAALIFAFALLLQGIAGIMLTGCEQ
jgi:hypothetical protein